MSRTVVGVLRGGASSEYDLSLKTGAVMLDALPENEYDVRDIFIDKEGYWNARGMRVEPLRVLSQLDVVLNGLHGGAGEDGRVQRILDAASVPYTGSRAAGAALSLNKIQAGITLKNAGIQMPQAVGFTLPSEMHSREMSQFVFSRFGPPYILKPANEGCSHGVRLVTTIIELPDAIADMLDAFGSALVEEYIRGEEATVGLIEGFRNENLYALPPAFVSYPEDAPFLHFNHHRAGEVSHMVPSNFSDLEKKALIDAARAAHRALGLSDFSRADFILTKRGPYLLEVNSLPGLHEHAAFPKMLESVGSSVPEFLVHSIGQSRI
ncbi:MAG: ATP-grasp domain-containing protein [Minisyncoccia bacterium]